MSIDYPKHSSGKVRDLYTIDDNHLLMVASDRLSAFDVVFPDPIPNKGEILTTMSKFWFDYTSAIIDNHLSDLTLAKIITEPSQFEQLKDRSLVVKKLKPLPIEAIVRGYIPSSKWQNYQQIGKICGISLPKGLQLSEKLPKPIFTPSSKAPLGENDQDMSFDAMISLLGNELATQVKEASLELYQQASQYALQCGVIIVDTKFEFGLDQNNNLLLIDEMLSPDSSRFWLQEDYRIGEKPPNFDKQYIRDYLSSINWDKQPPAPKLPEKIIKKTQERYQQIKNRLLKPQVIS